MTKSTASVHAFENKSLNDLVSIFNGISNYQIGKNNLVLDRDISKKLNYLTDNRFSQFSVASNIDQIFWFDTSLNDQISSRLLHLETEDEVKDQNKNENVNEATCESISLVFLLDLTNEENLGKLDKLCSYVKDNIINKLNERVFNLHLIINHPAFNRSLEKYLSMTGILGDLTSFHIWNSLYDFNLSEDIHSLELGSDAGFGQLYLDNSTLPLEMMARSLLNLYIGSNYKLRITNIYLRGDKSIKFWNIYNRLLKCHVRSLDDEKRKLLDDIDETIFMDIHSFYNKSVDFICLDRSNDLVSLLLNQLSYSGLITDLISSARPLDLVKFTDDNGKDVTIKLNDSNDNVYPIIKFLNFSHVGNKLNKNAKLLQAEFDKRKNLKDIEEMKHFVKDLNHLKINQSWVQTHTSLAGFLINKFESDANNSRTGISLLDDEIIDSKLDSYLNQLIEFQQDILADNLNSGQLTQKIVYFINFDGAQLEDIIKLIILFSVSKRGIGENDFNSIINELTNKFGVLTVLPIILNLKKLKIIQSSTSSNEKLLFLTKTHSSLEHSESQYIQNFQLLAKSLNLLPDHNELLGSNRNQDSDNLSDMYTDADFAFPGYVPILTRLIQSIYDRNFINSVDYPQDSANATNPRAIKYGWNNLDLSSLDGEISQKFLVPDSKRNLFSSIIPPKVADLNKGDNTEFKSTIVITVLGGITWSEIATIKYVLESNPFTRHKKLLILTTGIITGSDVIKSLSKAI